MNSRILNKVVLQSLRHSHCRYLSVQHNIDKCSSTCHTVNYRKSKENRSSSFIFTKLSDQRSSRQSSLPIYTLFQRNFSGTSQLNGAAKIDPLKDIGDVAPPIAEVTENAITNILPPEIVDNKLVEYAQYCLLQVHEASGLPWWASIALTTFFIRTSILLPFAVTQLRVTAKLEKVNLDIKSIEKHFKKEAIKAQKDYGWPEHLVTQKYEEAKEKAWWSLVVKENCHPMKRYFLITMQGATWISMTCAVSSLCIPYFVGPNVVEQMTTGGFGWITDLTISDPYLILPFSLGLLNLLIVEVHDSFRVLRRSKTEQWRNIFFRVVSIATIPMAAYGPAALNVYWLSSSLYGLLQAFVLNSSPVRRIFRVPMNDPGLKHPYRFFLKNTKEKLRLSKGETAIAAK